MTKRHQIKRVDDLMYKGCEPHWHCIICGGYWPFHCYSKEELEKMECKGKETRVTEGDK